MFPNNRQVIHYQFRCDSRVLVQHIRVASRGLVYKRRTLFFSNSNDSRSLDAIDSLRCTFVLVADSEGTFISAFNGGSTVAARPIIRYAASHVGPLILNNSKSTPDAPLDVSVSSRRSFDGCGPTTLTGVILTRRGDFLLWLSFTMAYPRWGVIGDRRSKAIDR